MATIYQKLGANIRKIRKIVGLSQEELGAKAKLDLTSISEIESGLRNPSLKTMYKIANALGVKVKDIFPF